MKARLVVISDLWGVEKHRWFTHYTRVLESKFDIKYYDSCELGKIDKSNYSQEHLHRQFVHGGVKTAVNSLLELEKQTVNILAFSIGGTIAWKFGIESNNINTLICVSSTRLRKETEKPNGKIELYFGENDKFRPIKEWFEMMKLDCNVLLDKEHEVYREPEFAKQLSEVIAGRLT